jgi:hypothetical protein
MGDADVNSEEGTAGNEDTMTLTPESAGFVAVALLSLILILLGSIGVRLNGIQSKIAVLSRMETKLDLLLKQANIKFDPYANLPREISEAVRAGQKIKAIKLYRNAAEMRPRVSAKKVSGDFSPCAIGMLSSGISGKRQRSPQ